MNRIFWYHAVVAFLLIFCAGCSSYRMRVANDYYEQNAFIDAIPIYEKVLLKQKNSTAMVRLADCYRQNNNTVEAEKWYRKVMNVRQQRPIDKLYFAQVLMTNGKYPEAKKWLEIYSHYTRADFRLQKLMESCDSLSLFFRDTGRYQISMLKLNVKNESNFAPQFYRSGIVFTSDRNNPDKKNLRNPWNGKGFTDLYYSKKTERGNWMEPELLRGEINGLYNDGPASFSRDFNTMYLTRNNYLGVSASLEKNKKNVNVLKVYKCVVDGNGWKIGGEMPICSDDYSVGHPSFNSSGTALYFTSDMPWGYGGTDLYVIKWINGRWSKPQNLGPEINSPGNEMFPFIQHDTILYYSSDGNYGLGGLDIFESIYTAGSWSNPVNIGYPINSSFDDSGYILDSMDQKGYFSSNRMGGIDKIFEFEKALPALRVSGIVADGITSEPLMNIQLILRCAGLPDEIKTTKQDGRFEFPLMVNQNYTLTALNKDFYLSLIPLNTYNKRESGNVNVNFTLEKIIVNKPVVWKSIEFNKKEWVLPDLSKHELDKLADQLKQNPSIQIELASYTDSRGSDQENSALTQKRADACYNYLVEKGVSWSRIKAKGYGETKLLNNCGNGILCLDEEHAENNRIEIKITENN